MGKRGRDHPFLLFIHEDKGERGREQPISSSNSLLSVGETRPQHPPILFTNDEIRGEYAAAPSANPVHPCSITTRPQTHNLFPSAL